MNILILYHYTHEYPMRSTIRDHLYSFKKYSNAHCFYLNIGAVNKIPDYLLRIQFDIIIFHTTFLSCRWGGTDFFKNEVSKVLLIKDNPAVKVALPQDEFIYCDDLCDFINEFGISCVFSVAPKSEWHKIYATVDFSKVKFYEVLTGYLDENTVKKIQRMSESVSQRGIDIGYRAYRAPYWLGSHGYLKTKIADVFQEKAPKYGLKIDMSTNPKDTILGDDWYRFLLKCKYFIGVEGGSTVMDRNGSIKSRTDAYTKSNPEVLFEEAERECFPRIDGKLNLLAISPRQLEACATKTCQILIEGNYNGILKPGVHYIELKKDFSNLDEVLKLMKNDNKREDITENAYRDIVESQNYTCKNFVKFIFLKALDNKKTVLQSETIKTALSCQYTKLRDVLNWRRVQINLLILPKLYLLINSIIKVLPKPVLKVFKNLRDYLKCVV